MMNDIWEAMAQTFIVVDYNGFTVHSHTQIECVIHVQGVLTILTTYGLKAKVGKCA